MHNECRLRHQETPELELRTGYSSQKVCDSIWIIFYYSYYMNCMMKQFEKPLKSPTLCKLAQDHADRLVNQYGGCLRKTDPSKRPNQGESLAMNMEESLKGTVQVIFRRNAYFAGDRESRDWTGKKMQFWMQPKCGTKKVSTLIIIIQGSEVLQEISLKWSGKTQPNLVLVLLEQTLGRASRTIERS